MKIEITKGKISKAERVVVYGPEGIGKSTFASQFPDPLFIDTEGSTNELDVKRLPAPLEWNHIVEEISFVINQPDCCKTLVIDTIDWCEKLCIEYIVAKADASTPGKRITSIEDFGYGKGYTRLAEEFKGFLDALSAVSDLGINVVLTAHAQMRKFERPDESGAYDRWELKLEKKDCPLVKEWATMVLFANYDIVVVKDNNNHAKAHGGQRVMYTTHHPCWDAKNRKGMPDKVPFSYESITEYIRPDVTTSDTAALSLPIDYAKVEENPFEF